MDARYSDDPRYQRATKRVEEIEGFVGHLIAYFSINAGLFVLNVLTNRDT